MKYLLLFFTVTCFSFQLSATHFIGGEITWTCDKDPLSADYGKYTFYMTIYQDCDGINFNYGTNAETITVHNNPSLTAISMNFLDTNDISVSGVSGSGNCYDCDNQPFGEFGAIREWVYTSVPIVLPGTPPANGWHFTWGTCCRSSQLTQPSQADGDWTIRSVMYPYTDPSGTVYPNSNMCYENSPLFKEKPKSILCTGYPFSYSHLAFDVELDSLSYSWAEPLGDEFNYDPNNPNSIALPFDPPYSVNSPIPGNPYLDSQNGEISFNSNTAGIFVTCVKVTAFKCGQTVAEVFRDVNVALIACGTLPNGNQNSPPVISAPIGSQNWVTNANPSTGLPSYETTIMAGELVSFSVIANDNDINITGGMQNLSLEVEGGQLDPVLALSNPATFNVTSSSPGNIQGDFLWQSNCDHMQDYGCGIAGGAYTFNLKAYDDFCPANGIVIATITINVIPPQPDLRCLSVDASGGVDLFYAFPEGVVDTNIKYDIYHSKQKGGPYNIIDSTFYPDTNYYHSFSDANTSKSYYFLLGTVTCGASFGGASDSLLYSDTLTTILMEASAINLGNTADLDWNPIHDPLLPSSYTNYNLHYINNNNIDNIIANLPDTFSQKHSDNCNYSPEFYVTIEDISGCESKSSIASVNLLDTITPLIPIIKDVSVNSGLSEITWGLTPGTDYYIVYIQDNTNTWITLDTVSSLFNSYIYQGSQANFEIENYSIRAVDSCGNSRANTAVHNSILLTNSSDACDYSILLNWNQYINWNGGVSHYNVFISEIDANNIITDTVIRVTGTTQLLLENIGSLSNYSVYIEANNFDSTFIAVSNILDISVALPSKPEFNYLQYATVDHTDGLVEINCLVDNNAIIDHYDIYRTNDFNILGDAVNFSKIDEVPFSGNTNFIYKDNEVNSSDSYYRYKVYPIDTCGISLQPPPINNPGYLNDVSYAQTILLEVETNLDYSQPYLANEYTNTISFNEYEKWLGEVSRYELFKSSNGDPFLQLPIYTWDRTLDPNEPLVFIDVVSNEGKGNGRFCYYIHAVEGNANPYGAISEGSYSNIACVSQTPIIFIPNTFTPNGDEHNEVFRPITYFVSEIGYIFSIFNQQGTEIFSTNSPQKGWDGRYKSKDVQDDNYVYYLKYINGTGQISEKTGVVTLVR